MAESRKKKTNTSNKTEDKEEKRGRKAKPTIASKVQRYTRGGTVDYFYVHQIHINQEAVIEHRWELDIIDLAVFCAISNFFIYGEPMKTEDPETGTWFYLNESKVLHDMPLLPLGGKSSIYKRITNLVKYDLLERNKNNSDNKLKLLRLGKNAKLLVYKKYKDNDLSNENH